MHCSGPHLLKWHTELLSGLQDGRMKCSSVHADGRGHLQVGFHEGPQDVVLVLQLAHHIRLHSSAAQSDPSRSSMIVLALAVCDAHGVCCSDAPAHQPTHADLSLYAGRLISCNVCARNAYAWSASCRILSGHR